MYGNELGSSDKNDASLKIINYKTNANRKPKTSTGMVEIKAACAHAAKRYARPYSM
jgi:hypothetical protein